MPHNKILLVDDDPDIRELLRAKLAAGGLKADEAESAEQAVAFMRERLYLVVIADMRLPGRSGVELVPLLKGVTPLVQVILWTGGANQDEVLAGLARGATDFLSKADETEQVIIAARDALERASRWLTMLDAPQPI